MSTLLDRQGLMHFTVHTFSIWFSADLTVKEKMQPLKSPVKEKKKVLFLSSFDLNQQRGIAKKKFLYPAMVLNG